MNNIRLLLYISLALYVIGLVTAVMKRNRACLAATACGFVIHSVFLVGRSWIGEIFIPGAVFQGVFMLPWAMALCVIVLTFTRRDVNAPGAGISLVIIFTALSILYPPEVASPMPVKVTAWSYFFFLTEICAQACFITGGWFAIRVLCGRSVESITGTLISWGFVLYTVAQVVGAIWAFLGWGTTFRWGTKHLQSAVIWIWYANYLHMRYIPGRSGKQRLWYAIAGSGLVVYSVFSYYSVVMKLLMGWL